MSDFEFQDDEPSDAHAPVTGKPGDDFSLGFHVMMGAAVLALVLMLVGVSIFNAKQRLNAPKEKALTAPVAAPSDLGFCTEGFKGVLRRVLDSCGLLTANQRRGCTPANVKQVAAISDTDFNALFSPLADRAGVIEFESGKDDLSPEATALLDKKWADSRGASIFLVVARASPDGSAEANQALSHKRANTVLFHLEQKSPRPRAGAKSRPALARRRVRAAARRFLQVGARGRDGRVQSSRDQSLRVRSVDRLPAVNRVVVIPALRTHIAEQRSSRRIFSPRSSHDQCSSPAVASPLPIPVLLSIVFFVAILSGFARAPATQSFDEITVHRINVVEPDGTVRLVLTNTASAPGIYIKNKEVAHPGGRKAAGLLFFDDEGTEDGGLVYGIEKDKSGHVVSSNVHLSFDQHMQDQIFAVDAGRDGDKKFSVLRMDDRGDYPITEALDAGTRIGKLPADQQAAEFKKFFDAHPGDNPRVILGRTRDGSSVLQLKDPEGHDRLVLRVAADGSPHLQFLDAAGKVLSEFPQSVATPAQR